MNRNYLAITVLLLAPLSAHATAWSFPSSGSVVPPQGITSINAFSATTTTSTFASATWANYGGNLGVTATAINETTTSPEHAMDNVGAIEALLFNFNSSTILNSLTIGWNNGGDADLSVLAYTGTLTNGSLPASSNVTGDSIATLLANGWSFIGSYDMALNTAKTINSANVSSSYWLISAYSSAYGSGKGDSSVNNGNDYFKLSGLTGTAGSSGGGGGAGSVPEPTSMLLLASGVLGWRMNRKNQALTA
ncbi:exosortase-dependent surface protein XDP1 [Methylomonas sp. 2BW1-5-20]|uniref:exosortase-dependent surface protein XDP1 n=1 Tax=Methylomonas sp. 2BW1-5-20 TaxID=3376686 RepID=UPI00404FC7F5